jgi:hypothetical protein
VGDVYYSSIEMELGATVNGSMVCETAKPTPRVEPAPIRFDNDKNKENKQIT